MRSRTLPSNFSYDQQAHQGQSSNYVEYAHASRESLPIIERISPDNKHPTFPLPTSYQEQHTPEGFANYAGKGKEREL